MLANDLLQNIYPHLAAPLPSMMVAHAKVLPSVKEGEVLRKGQLVKADTSDAHGRPIAVRLQTSSETPLFPFQVTEVELLKSDSLSEQPEHLGMTGSLKVRILPISESFRKFDKKVVFRFYLDTTQKNAFPLHELLTANLEVIYVTELKGNEPVRCLDGKISWRGMDESDAALPSRVNVHPGYRLLQEYFAFPEKFLFFEIPAIEMQGLTQGFDLYFRFNAYIANSQQLSPKSIELNCLPLVNLFQQRIEPLKVGHEQFEYLLQADERIHHQCEIYELQELCGIKSDGSQRAIKPNFEMQSCNALEEQDYFYVIRREENQVGSLAGSEVYISFLDSNNQDVIPDPVIVVGQALCTNRRLPEHLAQNHSLSLEGPGAVKSMHLLGKPSPHSTPTGTGGRPWALVSQLSLNFLSLVDGPQALSTLKEMLRCHVGPAGVTGIRQIDSIRRIKAWAIVYPSMIGGNRGFLHGTHIRLTIDRALFETGGMLLFASVLRYFFAMYASVNSVVQLSVEYTNSSKVIKTWEPLCGSKIAL